MFPGIIAQWDCWKDSKMKRKQTILDKNISRLVKLTADSILPSVMFVKSLINDALNELDRTQHSQQRSERNTTMKFTQKQILALAAVLIVAAGIFTIVKTELLNPAKDTPGVSTGNLHDAPGTTEVAMVPLSFEFPPAIVEGTPPNLSLIPNLETQVKRGEMDPFLVPLGTLNVAKGKPVTGSDENPIGGGLELITDGDKRALDGSWIEMGLFEQQVTIDLGAKHNIYAIVAWHYHRQNRVYYDVVVQVADDPDFINNVEILFNNDTDNTHGLGAGKDKNYVETNEGKLIDAKGVQARYVRLLSCGNMVNELNHYVEIEVHGTPVDNK
jgi:hypothetical protein